MPEAHRNKGKCLAIPDANCALKGGVCQCLSGSPEPSTVKGTEVAGLRAREDRRDRLRRMLDAEPVTPLRRIV